MKFQQLAEHKRSSLGLCNKLLASSSLLNLEMAFLLSRTFHIWLGLIIFSIKESIFYGFLWRKCLNMCSLWCLGKKLSDWGNANGHEWLGSENLLEVHFLPFTADLIFFLVSSHGDFRLLLEKLFHVLLLLCQVGNLRHSDLEEMF